MEKNIELQRIENFLETNEKIDVNGKMFKKIMFIYSVAQKEIENKLETLKNEFELFYDYELIDHINSRIKNVFDARYGLHLESDNLAHYTLAEIILPPTTHEA